MYRVLKWIPIFCFLACVSEVSGEDKPASDVQPKLNSRDALAAPIIADMVARDGYRLDDTQAVRRIPPPFSENRKKLYPLFTERVFIRMNRVRRHAPEPWSMLFLWDGKEMTYRGNTLSQHMHISQLLYLSGRLNPGELEVTEGLRSLRLPGDWVVRKSSTDEEFAHELQSIIQDELKLPVQLAFRDVERMVDVAKGTYHFTPLEGFETRLVDEQDPSIVSDIIQMMPGNPDPNAPRSYKGPGSCSSMVRAISGSQNIQIIDETEDPEMHSIVWRFHDAIIDPDLTLETIGKQTGLTFEKELRTVRRLIIEPKTGE